MSRYRVGVNAGPVHVSRRMGGSKKSGPLTSVLVWFIVKPLELLIRGIALPHNIPQRIKTPVATRGYFAPPASRPGWYDTTWGPLYFSGSNWYGPDGRALF